MPRLRMTAPRHRFPMMRRSSGPRPTGPPTAPRSGRSRPMPPPPAVPPRLPTRRPGHCRRSRTRLRPGPGRPRDSTRGPRELRAVPGPRGCPGRRGPRSPPPTSAVLGRVKEAKGAREAKGHRAARPGPRLRVPARQAALPGSAPARPRAVLTSRARARGRPRRGPRDLALPARGRPGQAHPVRARAPRVPARGRATTRSARPRPAWGRRLRPGLRARACLASQVVPALRRPVPAPPPGRVLAAAARVGPACPMAARVPAARVPAVPGRAR
jgi:hypothetical protein